MSIVTDYPTSIELRDAGVDIETALAWSKHGLRVRETFTPLEQKRLGLVPAYTVQELIEWMESKGNFVAINAADGKTEATVIGWQYTTAWTSRPLLDTVVDLTLQVARGEK